MRIARFIMANNRQFRWLDLDFTDHKTGAPLDKICFIGSNGTGKSTILATLAQIFRKDQIVARPLNGWSGDSGFLAVKVVASETDSFYTVAVQKSKNDWHVDATKELDNALKTEPDEELLKRMSTTLNRRRVPMDGSFVTVYCPPDTGTALRDNALPKTQLNSALPLFKQNVPHFNIVSSETVAGFWNMLIYFVKKRESDFQRFLEEPANQVRTVEEVSREFDEDNPEILSEIAKLWNRILAKAHLRFDDENATKPVQLTDNLEAYVLFEPTGQLVPYNHVSTGIRNYIFRLGHIFGLYFRRKIQSGILLIDEPENCLYPDLLYDLVDIYQEITNNTQLLVATHSPIVAAQFEPEERIILEFDEDGYVTARRGVSPIGDDPNDLLKQDFEVPNLLGEPGIRAWEQFLQLRRQIRQTHDPDKKQSLLTEYSKLGTAYNFETNEIPQEDR